MPRRTVVTTVFSRLWMSILAISPLAACVVVSRPFVSNLTAVGTAKPSKNRSGAPPSGETRQISPAAI